MARLHSYSRVASSPAAQAYGRGHMGTQASVRRAAAEALHVLRMASLALVEALCMWLYQTVAAPGPKS